MADQRVGTHGGDDSRGHVGFAGQEEEDVFAPLDRSRRSDFKPQETKGDVA